MNDLDAIRARNAAYTFFSRLFRVGLTAEDLVVVRSIDVLSPHVTEPLDGDEVAADHYALFGLELFPYAGAYLEPAGQAGGSTADAVIRQYDEGGYAVDPTAESADHLHEELGFMAHLTEIEVEAVIANRDDVRRRSRSLQRRFLEGHLLTWLPPFMEALRRQDAPFYGALGELTIDLIGEHAAALSDVAAAPERRPLPPATDPLGDERSGLKDVAVYLATPAYSGICLTRSDVERLSREEDLPRGFGSRAQTLTNLLRSGAEFDRSEALLDALGRRCAACRRYYEEADWPVPDVLDPWIDRVGRSEAMIRRMKAGLLRQETAP